jgi:hypothetical protein
VDRGATLARVKQPADVNSEEHAAALLGLVEKLIEVQRGAVARSHSALT